MGAHLDPEDMTKEDWLADNARLCRDASHARDVQVLGEMIVVLVDNRESKEAWVVVSDTELTAFLELDLPFPMKFYVADTSELLLVSSGLTFEVVGDTSKPLNFTLERERTKEVVEAELAELRPKHVAASQESRDAYDRYNKLQKQKIALEVESEEFRVVKKASEDTWGDLGREWYRSYKSYSVKSPVAYRNCCDRLALRMQARSRYERSSEFRHAHKPTPQPDREFREDQKE